MFIILQITISALLIVAILLQQKGSGLGAAFGGGEGGGGAYSTRRGLEKFLFRATIVLAVIFFSLAIARLSF